VRLPEQDERDEGERATEEREVARPFALFSRQDDFHHEHDAGREREDQLRHDQLQIARAEEGGGVGLK
jgi:hypothetical protein